VVQLYGGGEVIDERTATVPLATPRLISRPDVTARASLVPSGMDEVPTGTFLFSTTLHKPAEPFIPYPDFSKPRVLQMPRFFIDTYPVTNRAFRRFLDATHYRPKDTVNFLRHWNNGKIPTGTELHPVVWVSLEDARAYARWAGKRLPTTIEWQYAAQGMDGRKYPWGNTFDSTRCNTRRIGPTPVDAFPGGKGPFGTMDLVGNVWQMTADIYDDISYYFQLLRGGSYFNPTSSIWYVQGGPWKVDEQQMLLLLSPGFDRNATIGFRCVKDARQ
jgi:formylglycine-generating enzyme required for sulfatase activity